MIGYDILAIASGQGDKFMEMEANLLKKIASLSPEAAAYDDDEQELSRLLTIQDGVGVIEIKGGLTNRNSYWNRYFGMVAYDEIREAIIQAADNDVGSILFDYDTPGGIVSGMSDTANMISTLGIPTISFTSARMASAGYFLGSQSDYIYAGDFSEVGSIGVIIKLYDRSKMLADIGIKPEEFKSGDLKAIGSGDFKLTKKEKEHIQGQVDTYANKFFDIVSDARGMNLATLEKLGITSGKTFIGEESVKANLVDGISTFDKSIAKAYNLAQKTIDKRKVDGISYFS